MTSSSSEKRHVFFVRPKEWFFELLVLHGKAHLWPQAEPIQQMQQIETFPPPVMGFWGDWGRITVTPLVNTCGGENLEKAGKPKKN